jgi:hypothetical protein
MTSLHAVHFMASCSFLPQMVWTGVSTILEFRLGWSIQSWVSWKYLSDQSKNYQKVFLRSSRNWDFAEFFAEII